MSNEIIWTSTEAEAVTGGRSTQDWYATGVSMSLAELKPGDLYIATPEDDLNDVFQKGAAAVVISSGQGEGCAWPLLKVGNVYQALQDLARAARFKTHAHIISVQGRAARDQIHGLLSKLGGVHEGGRHLSLGLAGLPENIDYGLFGSSPAVQPDIAIITNSASANRDTLFETMPVSGTVLIHTDEDHLNVVARAKAAGIQNIYTFGDELHADARIMDFLDAGSSARVSLKVLDEEHSYTSPSSQMLSPAFVAGLLVLKLTSKALAPALQAFELPAMRAEDVNNIALMETALEKTTMPQAVFKVTNMIDLGFGRQTAILDNLANFSQKSMCFPKKDLSIPRQVESLNFMYTNKTIGAVRNAHDAIQKSHKNARIEEIAPEALVPGDFVVFKDIQKRSKAVFSEALRLIPNLKRKKVRTRMLYNLLVPLAEDIQIFNLFRYLTFRTGGAIMTALIISFIIGPKLIDWLRVKQKKGQPIREDGPETHFLKAGTPTMGGLMILISVTISTILWSDLTNPLMWYALMVMVGYGVIGFVDDYLKVSKSNHKGLSGKLKLLFQTIIALVATYGIVGTMPENLNMHVAIPFFKDFFIFLSGGFFIWAVFVMIGASNAVNLTDGLDGLAIVPVAIAAASFGLIAYLVGNEVFSNYLQIPHVPGTGELAILCGALIGGAMGFLWFNAPPAMIFMGDTGSLAMGGVLGAIAVMTKHELVLAIIGGLFVLETVSVIIQVVSFKLTGKRVFAMAPIHHHFEKKGWSEPTIVIRFWIIAVILALIGLATLKLR